MTGPAEVVVRNRPWLRLLSLPLLGLGICAWLALFALVTSSTAGIGIKIVIGFVVLVLALAITLGAPAGLLLKETFSPTEITVRKYLRTHRIEAASASRIRQVRAAVRTGRFQVPIGRLQVVGDETAGPMAPRAILDETLTHAEAAMAVLDEWVRRRPELVADDRGAREVFESRGVLAPRDA